MKKLVIGSLPVMSVLLLLLCLSVSAYAAGAQPQVGSIEYYLQSLGLHKVASGELVDHELSYTWNFVDWSLTGRTTRSRDGQDRPTTVLMESREGDAWVNEALTTTTYDGTGAIETVDQDWSGSNWVNQTRSTFENDGEQRPIVTTEQTWNGSGWDNQSRSRVTYEMGEMIAESYADVWEEGAWVEIGKSVYTYSEGHSAELVIYAKQGLEFVPLFRTTFTYNGDLLEQTLVEQWIAIPPDPATWIPSSRITYTYEGDLRTEALTESYSAFFPPVGWAMSHRSTMEYDGQDRLTVKIEEEYLAGKALDWQNSTKTEYYYEAAAVRQLEGLPLPDQFTLEQNYPNPFNPSTEIRFALTRSAHVTLEVCDLLGRKVGTLVDQTLNAGTHEADFDATGLASGVYFYRLRTDNFTQTRKMLLLK